MPTSNDKLLNSLLKRAAANQGDWQQEVKPAGMGVYGDDYWDKLAMRPEPEIPTFSAPPKQIGMIPPEWNPNGAKGPNGEPLPYGAQGWLPNGDADYGPGFAGWVKGLWSRLSAPMVDTGKPLATLKHQTVAPGQDIWSDFPSNAPKGGVQTTVELGSWKDFTGGEAGAALGYASRGVQEAANVVLSAFSVPGEATERALGVAQGIGEAADKAAPDKAITLENIRERTGATWLPDAAQFLLDAMPVVTGYNSLLAWQSPEFREQLTFKPGQLLTGGHPFLKEGSDLDAAYQAARMQYTAYIDPAARAEFINRYKGYESAAALEAELENPLAEFAGQLILDPLNFMGMGARKARDASRLADAFTEFVKPMDEIAEVLGKHGDILDDVKGAEALTELAAAQIKASQKVAAGLDEMAKSVSIRSLTATGRRQVVARRIGEVLGRTLADHGPADTLDILHGVYLMGSDHADEVANGIAIVKHAKAPQIYFSRAGEELGVVLRRTMPNGPDEFLKGFQAAQAGGVEAVLEFMGKTTGGAIDGMFPRVIERMEQGEKLAAIFKGEKLPWTVQAAARSHEALQKVVAPVNRMFAEVYMQLNYAFAMRNGMANEVVVFVDEGARAVFHRPKYWMEKTRGWLGLTPKGIGGYSGGNLGMETGKAVEAAQGAAGWRKLKPGALSEAFESGASAQVVGRAVDKAMRSMLKEGRAIPATDGLIRAGATRAAAQRLVDLVIQHKSVEAARDAWKAEVATGIHEVFRSTSWLAPDDLKAAENYRFLGEFEDILQTAGSREEALSRLDDIFRNFVDEAAAVVDDAPVVDATNEMADISRTMDRAADLGRIENDAERLKNITYYTQANANAKLSYEDVLRQVRAERPDDPAWEKLQSLLDYRIFEGPVQEAFDARQAAAWALDEASNKKDFDIAKAWGSMGLPGEIPENVDAFRRALWDQYYYGYVRKIWQDSRDEYVQAVEAVLTRLQPSDPRKLEQARASYRLAQEWDNVLRKDEVKFALEAARRRGDNAALARTLAHQYGIASATDAGVPMDKRILDTINKYLPEGQDKYASLADVPEDVAKAAFNERLRVKAGATGEAAADTAKAAEQAAPVPPAAGMAPPSYARSLHEAMPELRKLFDRLRQGIDENWGKVEPAFTNRELEAELAKWTKEGVKRYSEAQLMAAGAGNAARDFTLLNYGQKTGLDLALSYIFPYQFWYSRTYANWMKRLAYNPEVIAAYAKYKDYMAKIHAGAPEWWKYNINTNDLLGMDSENPLFFNLEATINPLYGLLGVDFNDPERRVDWWSANMDYLGKFGPSIWTPFNIALALSLKRKGEDEAAARWGGRLIPQTALLKSLLSVGNVNIKTGEGFNEFDPAILIFSNGMDPHERARVGRQLGAMVDQGLVDSVTAQDAAYSQKGELWDAAAMQAIRNRAPGQILGSIFGVGFKARNLSDIAIDQFDQERRRLYTMKPDMSPEEYRDAWTQLKQKYPFADTVMLSRGSGPERDESYAFSVLGRIPPGQKDDLMELMGVSGALYDKFYDDKGNMSAWNPTDQQRFMAAVVDLGAILDLPDEATTREWNAAKDGYAAMQAEMRAQFGSDIQDKIDRYFAAKKNGTEAGEAVLQLYPEVQQALDFQAGRVVNSPDMAPYYSSIDKIERYYKGVMYNAIEAEVGADIWDKWDEYNLAQLDGTQRKYWREHPELERYIELRDDYQKVIAQAITNVAGKLKSPVFPALRDADNLSTGQQAALDAIQNPAGNPYRVSWEELSAGMSQPLQNLVLDYVYTGEDLPSAAKRQLEYLAGQMGVDYDTLLVMIGNSLR
jgi:hypothetical protein